MLLRARFSVCHELGVCYNAASVERVCIFFIYTHICRRRITSIVPYRKSRCFPLFSACLSSQESQEQQRRQHKNKEKKKIHRGENNKSNKTARSRTTHSHLRLLLSHRCRWSHSAVDAMICAMCTASVWPKWRKIAWRGSHTECWRCTPRKHLFNTRTYYFARTFSERGCISQCSESARARATAKSEARAKSEQKKNVTRPVAFIARREYSLAWHAEPRDACVLLVHIQKQEKKTHTPPIAWRQHIHANYTIWIRFLLARRSCKIRWTNKSAARYYIWIFAFALAACIKIWDTQKIGVCEAIESILHFICDCGSTHHICMYSVLSIAGDKWLQNPSFCLFIERCE